MEYVQTMFFALVTTLAAFSCETDTAFDAFAGFVTCPQLIATVRVLRYVAVS